jgi:hypothetical protein
MALATGATLSSRAVKSFVGIAAVAALAWMLWRAERLRFEDSVGAHHTDAAQSSPAKEGAASDEANARELASASDPSRNARAELASLTGTLKVSGEDLPLAGFLITMEKGFTHRTDSAGGLRVRRLTPGAAPLRVDTSGPFDPLERSSSSTPVSIASSSGSCRVRAAPWSSWRRKANLGSPGCQSQAPACTSKVRWRPQAFLQPDSAFIAGSGSTDAGGRCVLGGMPAGDFALVAEAEGHMRDPVPVSCWYRDEKSRARPRTILLALSRSRPSCAGE